MSYDNSLHGSDESNNIKHNRRALIFNLLYAADAHNYESSLESIAENLSICLDCNIDNDIFQEAKSIIEDKDSIDQKIRPFISSNWKPERISVITRLILRFGAWELINTDLSSAIVINEAVELAKCYAERDAYKFINGILDEFNKKYLKKT